MSLFLVSVVSLGLLGLSCLLTYTVISNRVPSVIPETCRNNLRGGMKLSSPGGLCLRLVWGLANQDGFQLSEAESCSLLGGLFCSCSHSGIKASWSPSPKHKRLTRRPSSCWA